MLLAVHAGVLGQMLARAQQTNSVTVNQAGRKVELRELLSQLEKQYGVKFNYKPSLIKNKAVEATDITTFSGQVASRLNALLATVELQCKVINSNSLVIAEA
ncbi:MAG: hypothetical protein ACK4GN_03260, partial [Runella sp.]